MSFLETTNFKEIQNVAKVFLHLPIKTTEFSPIIISHPFWYSSYVLDLKKSILEDSETYQKTIDYYEKRIEKAENLHQIFCMIEKPFKLGFLKYTKPYMTREDFSKTLKQVWIVSENPNQDPNVPVSELIKWFKEADKKQLMDEEEYSVYSNLPDVIKVFRGVSPGRNPNGLSWTSNYEVSQYFKSRFENNKNKGFIRQGYINKENALAYFNSRDEDELVIDIKHLIKAGE